MILGVTGKSGSGKTTFSEKTSSILGMKHLKIDDVCKLAIEKLIIEENSWLDAFNIRKNYEDLRFIDTKKIGDFIFNDRDKYRDFISIVWKIASKEIDECIKQNDNVILDYILLPKTQYWDKCNIKILLDCDLEERKERVLKRDDITEDYFNLREKASIEYEDFHFDYVYDGGKLYGK